jgi:hypothetical protein
MKPKVIKAQTFDEIIREAADKARTAPPMSEEDRKEAERLIHELSGFGGFVALTVDVSRENKGES